MEAKYKLRNALIKAGLKTAFTGEADFSGITKEEPLMLEQILHKTSIELDEEKTVASAATVTTVRITGIPSYKVFKADHPFVFFIIDNSTRAIFFMGRYVEPPHGEKVMEDEEILKSNIEKRKREKFAIGNTNDKLLLVVDNKIRPQAEIGTINPDDIESVEVIKNKEEIRKYSPGDYDGAIIITLKKKKKRKHK